MNDLKVAGLDPSFRNFGMVKGIITFEGSGAFDVTDIKLIETKKDPKKKRIVHQNTQDLERSKQIYEEMTDFIKDVDMVFAELPHGSQGARSAISYGICIMALAAISVPLVQVSAEEVKLVATGKKTATKAEMIRWAMALYPEAAWFTKKVKNIVTYVDKNEHIADAIATVYAGVRTSQFQIARTFIKP